MSLAAEERDLADLALQGNRRRRLLAMPASSTFSGRMATSTVPGAGSPGTQSLASADEQIPPSSSPGRKFMVPTKAGREAAQRLAVDLERRADLLDIALVHHADAVGDRQRLLLVVGDVDGGDAEAALDVADILAQLDAQLRVEIGQRLVHEQQRRADRHGARQADALLLAAGHLGRQAVAGSPRAAPS